MEDLARLWRRADQPVAAHDLCAALVAGRRYARARGIAQQAARLARAVRLPREPRARLLAAAWCRDLGHGLGGGFPPAVAARALRRAGHEPLARLVANCGGAALEAALRGLPAMEREFPRPAGGDALLLDLLDVADGTTSADGARATPAARLREVLAAGGPADPSVRALVACVARLGEDPVTRALVESVAPRAMV